MIKKRDRKNNLQRRSAAAMLLAALVAFTAMIPGFSSGGDIHLINDLGGYGSEISAEAQADRDWNEDIVSVAKSAWLDAHAGEEREKNTNGRTATSSVLPENTDAASASDLSRGGDAPAVSDAYDVFADFDEDAAAGAVNSYLKKAKKSEKKQSGEFLRNMLKEAVIPEAGVPRETDLGKEILALDAMNDDYYDVFHLPAEYQPTAGDILFVAGHISTGDDSPASDSDVKKIDDGGVISMAVPAAVSLIGDEPATASSLFYVGETEAELTKKEYEKTLRRNAKHAVLAGIIITAHEDNRSDKITFLYSNEKEKVEIGVISENEARIIGYADMEQLHNKYCGILEEQEEEPEQEEEYDQTEKPEVTVPEKAPNEKTEYTWKDGALTVTATLTDPEAVPDDAELVVTPVTRKAGGYNYRAYMDALASEIEDAAEENTALYDVAFLIDETDENGEKTGRTVELQPEHDKVKVSFRFDSAKLTDDIGARDSDKVKVVHLPLVEAAKEEAGTTRDATDISVSDITPAQLEANVAIGTKTGRVEFATEGFSVFAIVYTDGQLKKTVIDAKGDTWEITVAYGKDAQIPDGTELKVTEYSRDDLLFNECFSEREKWAAEAAGSSEDGSQKAGASENTNSLTFEQGFGDAVNYEIDADLSEEDKARAASLLQSSESSAISGYILFDISLVYNGAEIEPMAPVQVTIQSADPQLQEYDEISVGHFVDDAAGISPERSMETIDEITVHSDDSKDNTPLIVDFETSSFSLYDVTGIRWSANRSKTVYFALKTGINKVLGIDQNGAIPVRYSEIENMDPSAVSAYIRALPDYATVEPLIIYDKSGTDFYAIDGNGNLAQVYESGDMVLWNGQPSIGWKLIRYMNDSGEYTGYYDFINMETGKFLAPQAGQTISENRIGVQLDGAAGHNTTIKAWDSSVNAYRGYSIQNNQLVTTESKEWFFASVSQTVSNDLKLQTVDTVDSTSLGVTIRMFNYPNTLSGTNRAQYQTNFQIFNNEKKDWIGGPVIQGLVENQLNSAGFPVATYHHTDLDGLFTGGNDVTATNANHLFIKQTYEETGYFEYSSFENYAYLGNGTDFTVYRQIGVPQERSADTRDFFQRGNFFPYSNIADYQTATQYSGSNGVKNLYDEDGQPLSDQDPRKGEALFLGQATVDYFFGMSMEAHFYQPVDGKNNGEDIIYEFNGDDDLWVFIDNILVLDIGGCHDAHSGSINFSTGEVLVNTGNGTVSTTIKQCFADAHIFPDGTPWDNHRVNQYFRGDTFADYSQHNMKMFYMERGAGASNLHIKFNLPVIKDAGKLIVDKVVSGTQNAKYANDKFPFQVIKVDGNTETRFTEAVYDSNGQPVEYQHEAVINGITYNDVFYLRPGEAAVFDVSDNTQQYYVKELGIDTRYYDRVLINREASDIADGIAESSVSSVKNRNRVTYDNHGVTEDLRIKKIVEGNVKSNRDMFEFYVYLTGPDSQLIPYSNGDYYVLDPNGNYCTYVDGLPIGDSTITEETRTAYHSGLWGTIGSIPDGYTVWIPDLLVGTDFMVSERIDTMPAGYEFKSIVVEDGTAETVNITKYLNVTAGDAGAITIGTYSYSNHCEGKLKKDSASDATVTVTNMTGVELPLTGGPGTFPYHVLGLMITAFSLSGLVMLKRRRDAA